MTYSREYNDNKEAHIVVQRVPVIFLIAIEISLVRYSWSRIWGATMPDISLKLYTQPYQWSSLNRKVLQRALSPESRQYFTSLSASNESITSSLLAQFQALELEWVSFDCWNQRIWSILINTENLNTSTCAYPTFLKRDQCKHCLDVLIRLSSSKYRRKRKTSSGAET